MLGDFLSSIADCERVILEVAARFDLDYYLFKENANTKDEGVVQGLKGLVEQIIDVAKSGEDKLLQVKKYMSSLIRALRKLSSAFSHLKDYAIGLKILELGLAATGTCEEGNVLATEIRNDISVLRARCAFV